MHPLADSGGEAGLGVPLAEGASDLSTELEKLDSLPGTQPAVATTDGGDVRLKQLMILRSPLL